MEKNYNENNEERSTKKKDYHIRGNTVYINNKHSFDKAMDIFNQMFPGQKKIKKDLTRRLHERY